MKMSMKKKKKRSKGVSDKSIGFSVGGAKDVNSFRDNILSNGRVPQLDSLTFEGIFYDYYFETEDAENEVGIDEDTKQQQQNEGGTNNEDEEELPLFYPSYTYSKSQSEYFLTIGLNSNIKESDFERKPLNLICVLDVSGSMGSAFDCNSSSRKSKMKIANE